MNEVINIILAGILPELKYFFGNLNWTYIIMYSIILYGIHYKNEFMWYNRILLKINLSEWTVWITGILVGLTFCLFKWLEADPPITWSYISVLLRSWFLVVVFSSIIIDGIVKLLKFIGKNVDDKNEMDKTV